jgi:hypothetical protein
MPRPGIRCAALLACVPFLVALVADAMPTRITPIAEAAPRPPLAFDQYLVDLRDRVGLRPVIPVWFNFTNTGKESLTITDIVPSCGCLSTQLRGNEKVYRPGHHGRLVVMMQTANEEAGLHSYTVTVKYNDPQPREETVAFRLVLPDVKVSVEPSELLFYQINGDDGEATVRVSDRRATQLTVLEADCTLPGVTVEVLPAEPDENGQSKVPIKVHVPGQYPAGRHRGLIRIATSDPEFKELKVSVYVEGAGVRQAGFDAKPNDPFSGEP